MHKMKGEYNMKTYFENAKTAEDLKSMYHKWCKQLHPDNGGNAAEFIAMRAEFKRLWTKLQDVHKTKEGKEYTSGTERRKYTSAEEYMDFVDWLISKLKVTVEINGDWYRIWGILQEQKDKQRALKEKVGTMPKFVCKWDNRGFWCVRPKDWIKKSNKVWTIDEIRNGFGSTVYSAKEETGMVVR